MYPNLLLHVRNKINNILLTLQLISSLVQHLKKMVDAINLHLLIIIRKQIDLIKLELLL
jgi:hypothetical protein